MVSCIRNIATEVLRKISQEVFLPECKGKMVSFANIHCAFWMHDLK